VDPGYFRHRVRDHLLTVAAGPASNAALAFLAALCLRFVPGGEDLFRVVLYVNVGLMVFNLLPLPPLDGGWFLKYATGMSNETFVKIGFYMGFVLLILINVPQFRLLLGVLFQIALVPFKIVAGG
jgi:Zn-dependent protease